MALNKVYCTIVSAIINVESSPSTISFQIFLLAHCLKMLQAIRQTISKISRFYNIDAVAVELDVSAVPYMKSRVDNHINSEASHVLKKRSFFIIQNISPIIFLISQNTHTHSVSHIVCPEVHVFFFFFLLHEFSHCWQTIRDCFV